MSAGLYDINLEQGSTLRVVFEYSDAAGNPITITGAHLEIRPSKSSKTVLLDVTEGNGFTLDGEHGKITMKLDGDVLAGLNFSSAWYDLKGRDAAGEPDRIIEGRVSLSRQVTV